MVDLAQFYEAFGKPEDSRPASNELLHRYRGILPDDLLDVWKETGFSQFRKGLVWTIEPASLQGELRRWPSLKQGKLALPVLRTAFGKLIYWGSHQFIYLDVHLNDQFDLGDNTGLLFNLFLTEKKAFRSVLNGSLFKAGLKKLGRTRRG